MSDVIDLTSRRPWVPADTFGSRLALVRQHMGWNMREAAVACDVNRASWPQWERDTAQPRRMDEVARKIADASGCDYLWLMAGNAALIDRDPDRGPHGPGGQGIRTTG